MTAGLPLMERVLTPLSKGVLLPLGLLAGMSVAEAAIKNKIYGSGGTALTIANEKMEDIMKIVKSLEESGLLVKGMNETVNNETKEQKVQFLPMSFGALAASMLGSALKWRGVIRVGAGTIRPGKNF